MSLVPSRASRSVFWRAALFAAIGLFLQINYFWIVGRSLGELYEHLRGIWPALVLIVFSPFFLGVSAGASGKDWREAGKIILWAACSYTLIPASFVILGVGDAPNGYYSSGMMFRGLSIAILNGLGVCALGGAAGHGLRIAFEKAAKKKPINHL